MTAKFWQGPLAWLISFFPKKDPKPSEADAETSVPGEADAKTSDDTRTSNALIERLVATPPLVLVLWITAASFSLHFVRVYMGVIWIGVFIGLVTFALWRREVLIANHRDPAFRLKAKKALLVSAPFIGLFLVIWYSLPIWLLIAFGGIFLVALAWANNIWVPIGAQWTDIKLSRSGIITTLMLMRKRIHHRSDWVEMPYFRFDLTDLLELLIIVFVFWHNGILPFLLGMKSVPLLWYWMAWFSLPVLAFINCFDKDTSFWEMATYCGLSVVGFLVLLSDFIALEGILLSMKTFLVGWGIPIFGVGLLGLHFVILPRRRRNGLKSGKGPNITQTAEIIPV